jgi:hypothetical protein
MDKTRAKEMGEEMKQKTGATAELTTVSSLSQLPTCLRQGEEAGFPLPLSSSRETIYLRSFFKQGLRPSEFFLLRGAGDPDESGPFPADHNSSSLIPQSKSSHGG